VTLVYRVPGVRWAPDYRLKVQGGSAQLERWALVDVPAGYDWPDAALRLASRRADGRLRLHSLAIPVLRPAD
jgi:hypothetical protein